MDLRLMVPHICPPRADVGNPMWHSRPSAVHDLERALARVCRIAPPAASRLSRSPQQGKKPDLAITSPCIVNLHSPHLTLALLLLVVCTSACVRRDGRNSDCTWPGEAGAVALDPSQPAASRHLSADTEYAEELADRFTNVHYGPHSGYVGPPIAGRERHGCMVILFQKIAETHGVSTDQVIAAFGHNRLPVDLAEILSFALVFALLATLGIARIWSRYPPGEEQAAGLLMIALGALAFGVAAVMMGPMWSATAENIRIGTGHLGPRALRLPMERYSKLVFAAGVISFLALAWLRRPRQRRESEHPG
ncbi:MAG TPA: hypothetical protein VFU76_03675 [Terriglobales bacterium]|nr:hypothetical protein [Terriglobales bacterium]